MLKAQIVPVTGFQQNCSIIWCDETMEGALVDPGGDYKIILAKADELGINLTKIWLTHGHLDHAGGSQDIRETRNLPVIGPHKEDQFWLDGIEEQAAQYGMPGLRCCVPDQYLEGGEKLTLGNLTFDVIHCPGHTPGHVVLFEPESKIAFVGDVIFKDSIGRTDFPRGNHQDLIDSITQKLWPLGDDVTFVPGHGPLSTFGSERKTNPYVADHLVGR